MAIDTPQQEKLQREEEEFEPLRDSAQNIEEEQNEEVRISWG